MIPQKQYIAFAYLRLSKEDGDKPESDSITNQRKLIQTYISNHKEILLIDEIIDDGWSGTSFQRPGMTHMLERLKRGEGNCVIVKDLSRFGRDFIQVGRYIQKIFPQNGIRFIAINDDVDTIRKNQADDILIPVKNLMNDSYCSELSRKLRNQFQVQWRNGEFLGPFAAYGYVKSPDDKHQLVIDDYAAEVVRGIFCAKIQGYSMIRIAEQLNYRDILSPTAYKRSKGMNYHAPCAKDDTCWSVHTIRRILKNRLYLGDLEQGKRYKEHYKSNRILERPQEEWVVVHNHHEPIVDIQTFEAVQRDLASDTRCMDETGMTAPLGGLLFCAECGRQMIQKRTDRGRKSFTYYICSSFRKKQGCTSHSISRPLLEEKVRCAINAFVCSALDVQSFMEKASTEKLMEMQLKKVDEQIRQTQAKIEKNNQKQTNAYELKLDGTITKEEFILLKDRFAQRIRNEQQELSELERQRREILAHADRSVSWLTDFRYKLCFDELSRETALMLLKRVTVSADKEINITFVCQDEYEKWSGLMAEIKKEVG